MYVLFYDCANRVMNGMVGYSGVGESFDRSRKPDSTNQIIKWDE